MLRSKSKVLFCCAILLALVWVFVLPAHAQQGELIVEKKAFKPFRYAVGNGELGKVYNFTGFAFDPGFKEVIEQDADALAAAKKGFGFNGLVLGGSITMVVGSALLLSNTLKDAQNLQDDRITNNSDDLTPLVLVVVGGLASVVGSKLSEKHLRKGVAIYNANRSTNALQLEKRGPRLTFNIKRIEGTPGVELIFSW